MKFNPSKLPLIISVVGAMACTRQVSDPSQRGPDAGGGGGGGGGAPCLPGGADSDADGLSDAFESALDHDGDGLVDRLDTDSDGDGISDTIESGMLGNCAASNADADGAADYLDNDSDNDGLSDREESSIYFTDTTVADSDGDGFDDLAEISTLHDPNDATDGLAAGDFYLVLPYGGEPEVRDLPFNTSLRKADVFFMMDRTGSMTDEETALRTGLTALVNTITATIPDVGVGFGGFADFPVNSYAGFPDDTPYSHISDITTDVTEMNSAVRRLRADQGGNQWASSGEALYQAATGEGIGPWVPEKRCASVLDEAGRRAGYPCFRPGALPILVTLTDTSSRNGPGVSASYQYTASYFGGTPPHTYEETIAALQNIGARVFGVISGTEVSTPTPWSQFNSWATDTGTVNERGTPIEFMINSDGTGLTTSVADAIEELATETPQDITTRPIDGEDYPTGHTPVNATRMIKAITPSGATDSSGNDIFATVSHDDVAFYAMRPGNGVNFDVRFQNDIVEPAATAQVFRATILVLGNGVAELDAREVVIVVPTSSEILY